MMPLCPRQGPAWLRAGAGSGEALQAAAEAAQQGAEATRGMTAAAGRSSYVPEAVLADVPDPGARAVALWLGAVAKALSP